MGIYTYPHWRVRTGVSRQSPGQLASMSRRPTASSSSKRLELPASSRLMRRPPQAAPEGYTGPIVEAVSPCACHCACTCVSVCVLSDGRTLTAPAPNTALELGGGGGGGVQYTSTCRSFNMAAAVLL